VGKPSEEDGGLAGIWELESSVRDGVNSGTKRKGWDAGTRPHGTARDNTVSAFGVSQRKRVGRVGGGAYVLMEDQGYGRSRFVRRPKGVQRSRGEEEFNVTIKKEPRDEGGGLQKFVGRGEQSRPGGLFKRPKGLEGC